MFLQCHGHRVYYETSGSGDPILLLHGWGVDSGSLRPIFSYVRDALGMRPVALDFPGFGLSDPPTVVWGAMDFSRLALSLMDKLDLGAADVLAHSFGGRVAITLAARNPERVRRLVLVDSAGLRPPRSAQYRTRVGLAKAVRTVSKALPESGGHWLQKHVLGRIGSTDYRTAGPMRPTFVKIVNEDLRDLLPSVRSPTLLIWGARDTATPLQAGETMHRLLPGSRLEVLPAAGHFAWVDDWSGFIRALSDFLGGAQR